LYGNRALRAIFVLRRDEVKGDEKIAQSGASVFVVLLTIFC
jgi:hypothetical protein